MSPFHYLLNCCSVQQFLKDRVDFWSSKSSLYDNLLREYKIAETSSFQEVQLELRTAFYPIVKYKSWKDWSLFKAAPDFTVYDGNNKELLNRYFNKLKMFTL